MRTGLAIGYVQLAILAHQRHQLGNGVFFLVQHFAVQHHTGNIIIVGQRNLDVVLILHELTKIIAGSNRNIHISRGVDQIVTLGNFCSQRGILIFMPLRIKSCITSDGLIIIFGFEVFIHIPAIKYPFAGTVAQLRQVSNRSTIFNRRHSIRLFTMPIVVKGHSVLVLFPLGVIGFTLFGGRILGFGLAFSVLIPFCGTSSLGYAVKTGLIHVNNAAIDNKDNAYIFTQPTIIVGCSRICRFVIHINAHIGIKWLSTRRRAQATVHIMNLVATCKINLLQICTLTESSISKFYVIGSHRKGFKRLCVTERCYHS